MATKNLKNGKSKSKKKQKRAKKYGIIFMLIIALLGIVLAAYWVCTSEKFNITKVNITQTVHHSYDELLQASEIELGKNIMQVSQNHVIQAIESLAYVKEVKVSRKYPDTIAITIIEREQCYFAYDKDSKKYVRIDVDGYILEILENTILKTEEEILILGMNFDDEINIGEKISEFEIEKIEVFEKLKAECENMELDKKITSVAFEENNITLTLNSNLDVIFTTSQLSKNQLNYKISILKTILKNVADKTGTIDMTLDNPTYSIIRK